MWIYQQMSTDLHDPPHKHTITNKITLKSNPKLWLNKRQGENWKMSNKGERMSERDCGVTICMQTSHTMLLGQHLHFNKLSKSALLSKNIYIFIYTEGNVHIRCAESFLWACCVYVLSCKCQWFGVELSHSIHCRLLLITALWIKL